MLLKSCAALNHMAADMHASMIPAHVRNGSIKAAVHYFNIFNIIFDSESAGSAETSVALQCTSRADESQI